MTSDLLIKTLDNGLIIRHATPADADELYDFNSRIHSDDGPDRPDVYVGAWTRDLISKPHPTMTCRDFTVVIDPQNGRIVSSACLIPQVWTYARIPFKVGRPELVGTAPEYRTHGLIRSQFEILHDWSRERGELAQVITGIPYYYRQFGYEMALDLGGARMGSPAQVRPLADGEKEPFTFRPAVEADIPLLMELDEQQARRSLVYCPMNEALWRYELTGKSAENVNRDVIYILSRASDGADIGYVSHPVNPSKSTMTINGLELKTGVPYPSVIPSIIRFVWKVGQELPQNQPGGLKSFGFGLGGEHPLYTTMRDQLPKVRRPYAFYMRVPDPAALIRTIAPELENRLAASACSGFSGECNLNFYRSGLRMVFEAGRMISAENTQPASWNKGDAGFPSLTFLQVLFGRRSLSELRDFFPDIWVDNDTAEALVNALFPRAYSHLKGIA